jgi:hypothetical protein
MQKRNDRYFQSAKPVCTSLFSAVVASTVRCQTCGTVVKTNQPYLDLSLPVSAPPKIAKVKRSWGRKKGKDANGDDGADMSFLPEEFDSGKPQKPGKLTKKARKKAAADAKKAAKEAKLKRKKAKASGEVLPEDDEVGEVAMSAGLTADAKSDGGSAILSSSTAPGSSSDVGGCGDGSATSKKSAGAKKSDDPSLDAMANLTNIEIKKMKPAEIKTRLREFGLSAQGNKSELQLRITELVESLQFPSPTSSDEQQEPAAANLGSDLDLGPSVTESDALGNTALGTNGGDAAANNTPPIPAADGVIGDSVVDPSLAESMTPAHGGDGDGDGDGEYGFGDLTNSSFSENDTAVTDSVADPTDSAESGAAADVEGVGEAGDDLEHHIQEKYGPFRDPPEDWSKLPGLYRCFQRFCAEEILEGDNMYSCTRCYEIEASGESGESADFVPEKTTRCAEVVRSDVDTCTEKVVERTSVMRRAAKQLLVSHAPNVLTVHLNRFEAKWQGFQKVTKHVSFPLVMDLSYFCGKDANVSAVSGIEEPGALYSLFGVVVHQGNKNSGHYVAYVKATSTDAKGKDIWWYASDRQVSKVPVATVLKAQGYLLFYERLL